MIGYFKFTYEKDIKRVRVQSDSSELFGELLDVYTVGNPQFFFLQQSGVPNADEYLSVISSTGTFQTGLFVSVYKTALKLVNGDNSKIIIDEDTKKRITEFCKPLDGVFDDGYEIESMDSERPLRYYQRDAIEQLLKYGKGICISPTASGKSLVISTVINELRKNRHLIKTLEERPYFLIVVPTRQLVDQMYKDLKEYGTEDICMWTSNSGKKRDDTFVDNSCSNGFKNIIITNHAWINSKEHLNNKKFPLKKIGCLIADEVHTISPKTKITKTIKKIDSFLRFGFTGTMPKFIYNRWYIIGLFGLPVFCAEIKQFQDSGFLSKLKIHPIRGVVKELVNNRSLLYSIKHTKKLGDTLPDGTVIETGTAFKMENAFFDYNCRELYSPIFDKISTMFDFKNRNMIILFDRLSVGKVLFDLLSEKFEGISKIHYTDGSIDVSKREDIRKSLENSNGNILIAQSVTASVGLNIKNLNGIAFAFSGKSYVRVIQSIGRVIRLKKDRSEAQLFEIFFNTRYSDQHHNERMKIFENNYGKEVIEKIEVVEI